MSIHILQRFKQLARYCYTTHLVEGQQDILGILMSIESEEDKPNNFTVTLVLINLQKQSMEQSIMYSGTGPGNKMATAMLLHYDSLHSRWIIAQLQNCDYIAMRTLSIVENGGVKLSPLCLLDYDDAAESPGMNPPLTLLTHNDTYSFLYPKPFDVHFTAPRIMKLDVLLQQERWNDLTEHAMRSDLTSSTLLPEAQEILLPDNAFFDPRSNQAHMTSAVHLTNQTALAEAEMSIMYHSQHIHLLILCSPEKLVKAQQDLQTLQGEQEQWRIWLTGWDATWTTQRWTYSPDSGVPTVAGEEYLFWPQVYSAAIAGPPTSAQASETVVVATAVFRQEEVLSHTVCLDEAGQIVQICASPLGLRPYLCCCEDMIVGVDLFAGSWRLWNWPVLQQAEIGTSILLETSCQRAFVYAEPSSARFWLIEELQEGLRVTHRSSATLTGVSTETYLSAAHLVPEVEERPLNGYHAIGIVPYQTTLLLLAWRPQEGLFLYQVQ